MKIKDLPLEETLPYPKAFKRVMSQLKRRGIFWQPSVWPSEEWFSPDGVDGIAFPFTLLDPKLSRLEKKHIGFCEGATEREFEMLLRHECAHALDNAFCLRKSKRRQKVFGISSLPYPEHYIPLPYSTRYVRHLPGNYAQAHPEEDWAETFAVWLGPKDLWRRKYAGQKALEKLETVDQLIESLKGKRPKKNSAQTPLHFRQDERTVREYLNWKKTSLGLRSRNFYSSKAKEIFTTGRAGASAEQFIRLHENELCLKVSTKTREPKYLARKMIKELLGECKKSGYRVNPRSPSKTKQSIEGLLIKHSAEFLRKKRHRITM